MHTLDDSLDTVRLTPAFGDPHAAWRARNDAGVSLALEGCWPEALEAFSEALTVAPGFADAPDVHALLHGNRAQAHFHCGEWQLAAESARRALAARLVCGEADDAPVARMRADLGVYLAACGNVADAEQSLQMARASLESQFGDDDLRLATVLENQARVQLLANRPDDAEPLLLRLHALLGERELPTDALTPLFDAVRHARAPVAVAEEVADVGAPVAMAEEVAHVAAQSSGADWEERATHAELESHLSIDEFDVFPIEAVDEALATQAPAHPDAIELVDPADLDLLVFDAIEDEVSASSLLDDDAFELIDAEDFPPMRSPSPAAIRSAGLVEPGAHPTPQEAMRRTHPLGFEIQYGIPQDQLLGGDAA